MAVHQSSAESSISAQSAQTAEFARGNFDASVDRAFELLNPDTPAAYQLASDVLKAAEPDSSIAGRAHHALGMSACLLSKVDEGSKQLQRAAEILDQEGPTPSACRAWRDYGTVLAYLVGDLQTGLEALERALAIVETLGDASEEAALLSRFGAVLSHAGRLDEGRDLLERARDLLENIPHGEAYAVVLSNLGHNRLLRKDYAEAVAFFRSEQALHDPQTARLRVANCDANLAMALAGVGELDEARSLLARARDALNPETDGNQWIDYLLTVGRVEMLSGSPHKAYEPLEQAMEAAHAQGLHRIEIELWSALAEAQEANGDLGAALKSERALRLSERHWLDEQAASRLRNLESKAELMRERAASELLEQSRAELEERVQQRTAELQDQVLEREAAQEKAQYWANHDWLTRLPNRRTIKTALEKGLEHASIAGSHLGVLFIDLDEFKEVNDSYGHLAGDHLLVATARRLEQHAPPGATVTRFGGDEFLVLLPDLLTPDEVMATARELNDSVVEPLVIDGFPLHLSCSIGVAIGPRDAGTAEELLRRADQALLEAKAAGKNHVLALDESGQQRRDRRSKIRRELEASITDGRLFPAFQPQWDLQRNRLHGIELLARMSDPELGAVSPAEFIPLAEESGLIVKLGLWAVVEATQAAKALRARMPSWVREDLRISVNLSSVQLGSPTLVDDLNSAVRTAGGKPEWLRLELTESRQLAEASVIRQRLLNLRALGFTLAIDDFGVGYSSFSYLSSDFFDELKIDRSLLLAAMGSPTRAVVIGSIVAMAHRLGLDVVGEGAESEEQEDLYIAQGCSVIQGFHIARPMPLDSLLDWQGPK
ncbi:EAL domain-containing protein [Congregibacter litoralis]|uniref:Diguanylate cyclase (GGDEF) domain protein n=1 Tax=Congregibacter litoralis KT71 TaxID=314285 RepID=A4A706_9GAMM|nr:EAL domain-containing protein [Congregibacter litoralis]EAQ98075.2 diguanylate cyclase (GGDEF) domain protein [Congregibacter litoralis KT71]